MDFAELLGSIPSSAGQCLFPVQTSVVGFGYQAAGLESFVPPDLSPGEGSEPPTEPRVIIISAAGAVGKSTLARQLAYSRGLPLWDLSKTGPVAEGSFDGMLVRAFGAAQLQALFRALDAGELCFVLDGLDEARVKVNEPAFNAFLGNVAQRSGGSGGPKVVMFGRTQAAVTTWLAFADADVEAGLLAIDPFSRAKAEQYIEKRVISLGSKPAGLMRQHPGPFARVRDLVFDHLREAINGASASTPSVAASDFLGYAPALDAVAVLLAGETNYPGLESRLGQDVGALGPTRENTPLILLVRMVEHILERERQAKLLENLRPILQPLAAAHGWSSWDALYAPQEQCMRLLGRMLPAQVPVPSGMPDELRQKYEEQLLAWLPEHPFLKDGSAAANAVFESYLLAAALCGRLGASRKPVEEWIESEAYRPSRLLAEFYLLFSEQDGTEDIPPAHIGLLYDSILSAETDTLRIGLSIDGPDPDEHEDRATAVEGEFELRYTVGGDDVRRVRRFRTSLSPSDVVSIATRLRTASIVVPCTLSLGNEGAEFELGPDVAVRCRELLLCCNALVVPRDASSRGLADDAATRSVVLEAHACKSSLPGQPSVHGTLRVSWPDGKRFPWTDYYFEPLEPAAGDAVRKAWFRFRRIVMTFRSHSRGGLARIADKVEHSRVLKGAPGKAVLESLVDDGILSLRDRWYYWVPERGDELLGISWQQLRNGGTSPELREYLRRVVSAHEELFRS